MSLPANPNSNIRQSLEDYSAAAVTTGTAKREWTVLYGGRVVAHARAEAAGSGTGSTKIDVNVNGTSILARVLEKTSTSGQFSNGEPASGASCRPGDVISYDIDAIGQTAHTRVSVAIAVVAP